MGRWSKMGQFGQKISFKICDFWRQGFRLRLRPLSVCYVFITIPMSDLKNPSVVWWHDGRWRNDLCLPITMFVLYPHMGIGQPLYSKTIPYFPPHRSHNTDTSCDFSELLTSVTGYCQSGNPVHSHSDNNS